LMLQALAFSKAFMYCWRRGRISDRILREVGILHTRSLAIRSIPMMIGIRGEKRFYSCFVNVGLMSMVP